MSANCLRRAATMTTMTMNESNCCHEVYVARCNFIHGCVGDNFLVASIGQAGMSMMEIVHFYNLVHMARFTKRKVLLKMCSCSTCLPALPRAVSRFLGVPVDLSPLKWLGDDCQHPEKHGLACEWLLRQLDAGDVVLPIFDDRNIDRIVKAVEAGEMVVVEPSGTVVVPLRVGAG